MPTLENIAEKTGLSISTVSRVLRGKADVSQHTRDIVKNELQRLGYYATLNNNTPRRGRPPRESRAATTLAIVCRSHAEIRQNPFTAPILAAALDAAAPLNVTATQIDWPDGRPLPAELQKCAGALLIGGMPGTAEIAARMPAVTVDVFHSGIGADGVTPDYRRGAFDAFTHLIAKGHRRIAMISGEKNDQEDFCAQLYDGARRAMDMAGVPVWPHILNGVIARPEEGYDLGTRLLKLPENERPTAIFGSDHAALGVLRAAHDLGIKVPEQLAVVGVDDIELGRYSVPRLSTVRVDKEALARVSMERLLWRVANPSAATCRLTIDCQFILRDSC